MDSEAWKKNEVDRLYSRNQYLRWIIIDELPMVSDNFLGCFEHHLADADKHIHAAVDPDENRRNLAATTAIGHLGLDPSY